MSERIVVTGVSGFLGGHVLKLLSERNLNVVGVSRTKVDFPSCVQVKSYDDTPGGDVLIHLADNPLRSEVNQLGVVHLVHTEKLMRTLTKNQYQHIVYASSAAIYDDNSSREHEENETIIPTDTYATAKLLCEKFVLDQGGVTARLSNLYGLGMSRYNVMSRILNQITLEGEIEIRNDKPIRDFLWVTDAVEAIILLAQKKIMACVNVGVGESISIREIINLCLRLTNQTHRKIKVTQPDLCSSSQIALSVKEIQDQFKWIARVSLAEGLEIMLNHMKYRD